MRKQPNEKCFDETETQVTNTNKQQNLKLGYTTHTITLQVYILSGVFLFFGRGVVGLFSTLNAPFVYSTSLL